MNSEIISVSLKPLPRGRGGSVPLDKVLAMLRENAGRKAVLIRFVDNMAANLFDQVLANSHPLVQCFVRGRTVTAWLSAPAGPPAEKKRALAAAPSLAVDAWTPEVERWLRDSAHRYRQVTTDEIVSRVIGIKAPNLKELMRAARILAALGYQHVRAGKRRRNAWNPPEEVLAERQQPEAVNYDPDVLRAIEEHIDSGAGLAETAEYLNAAAYTGPDGAPWGIDSVANAVAWIAANKLT